MQQRRDLVFRKSMERRENRSQAQGAAGQDRILHGGVDAGAGGALGHRGNAAARAANCFIGLSRTQAGKQQHRSFAEVLAQVGGRVHDPLKFILAQMGGAVPKTGRVPGADAFAGVAVNPADTRSERGILDHKEDPVLIWRHHGLLCFGSRRGSLRGPDSGRSGQISGGMQGKIRSGSELASRPVSRSSASTIFSGQLFNWRLGSVLTPNPIKFWYPTWLPSCAWAKGCAS